MQLSQIFQIFQRLPGDERVDVGERKREARDAPKLDCLFIRESRRRMSRSVQRRHLLRFGVKVQSARRSKRRPLSAQLRPAELPRRRKRKPTHANASPPIPHEHGSVRLSIAETATAASAAFPPARSISNPASAASGWEHAIIPLEPVHGSARGGEDRGEGGTHCRRLISCWRTAGREAVVTAGVQVRRSAQGQESWTCGPVKPGRACHGGVAFGSTFLEMRCTRERGEFGVRVVGCRATALAAEFG